MPGGWEAGSVSTDEQDFQLDLTFVAGFGFEGGHLEDKGITSSGNLVDVPLHEHLVEMDLFRVQASLGWKLNSDWNAQLRIPWSRKDRRASIGLIKSATSSEQADMQRNLDLHHGEKTLEGLEDFVFMARTRNEDGSKILGFGMSLPTGATEADPYLAATENRAHEHLQFGTGTVVPRVEVVLPAESSLLSAFLSVPVYENRHGFRAAPTVGTHASWRKDLAEDWTTSVGLAGRFQGYGTWNGKRDINTGYSALMADLSLSWSSSMGKMRLGLIYPLFQKTLSSEGDTFEMGTTLGFMVQIH